jgi:hypothetical protein
MIRENFKENFPKIKEERQKIIDLDTEKKTEIEQQNMFSKFSYELLNSYELNNINKKPTEKNFYSSNIRYFYSLSYYSSNTPLTNSTQQKSNPNLFELITSRKKFHKPITLDSEIFNLDLIPFSPKVSYQDEEEMKPKKLSKKKIICNRCFKEGHIQAFCTEKKMECNSCKKIGHYLQDCLNKPLPISKETILNEICFFCGKRGHLICKPKNLVIENYSDSSIDSEKGMFVS